MTEANLQVDSLEERPAQRAVDHHEMEEDDSSPHDSSMWSPVPRLPTGRPSMNYCLSGDKSNFNRQIRRCATTSACMDSTGGRRHVERH